MTIINQNEIIMQLPIQRLQPLLDQALDEDMGINGDITSEILITDPMQITFQIKARKPSILCGVQIAVYYLQKYSDVVFEIHYHDGDEVPENGVILSGKGDACQVLLLERVILNFMQHLSGIASLTGEFVGQIAKVNSATKARIYDTRKTLPGVRILQKYAVRCGGGFNHRLTLDSAVMIKDNHIAVCGSIKNAVAKTREAVSHYIKIEVECDNIAQVHEAVMAGADIILLDNMSTDQMKEAVKMINHKAIVEASGNVSLENVGEIACTGVDVISVGKLTHSVKAADIGLDII